MGLLAIMTQRVIKDNARQWNVVGSKENIKPGRRNLRGTNGAEKPGRVIP